MPNPIPLSILDLSFVREGETPGDALRDSLILAQHAEQWGYKRFWLAEHHNMSGIASAATSVAIGFIAGGTKSIRVGSGGIMLPNHAPLIIAEQFGTLESLYPGRIDLGLGRAPGTDPLTSRALRRDLGGGDTFPQEVQELQRYFEDTVPGQAVRAVPGEGLKVPLYILGSSLFGAQLAAHLGLPFAFASHFAPTYLFDALEVYRQNFKPSELLDAPYAMVAANVVVADTDEEAKRLFTSAQIGVINLLKNKRSKLQPPIEDIDYIWSSEEKAGVEGFLKYSFVGSPESVKNGITRFIASTDAAEVITTARIYDPQARLHSFELLSRL